MMKTTTIALMLAAFASAPLAAQDAPTPAAQTAAPPTKAEIEARLADAFAKYDGGAKGYLSLDEFNTMMAQEEGKADPARSQAAYAAADADNNGQMSLGEFTGFVMMQVAARMARGPGMPDDQRGGGNRRGKMLAQFDETWDRFDDGAKGYLTQDEFVAMMADIQTKIRIARVGQGSDTARPRRELDPVQAEARARASFAEADADGNSELTKDELKAQFAARASRMLQRRGARADTGGDGD
jgi:Ca2+-binding EF-hand superfamily protein